MRVTASAPSVWSPSPTCDPSPPMIMPMALGGDSHVVTAPGVLRAPIQPNPVPTTAEIPRNAASEIPAVCTHRSTRRRTVARDPAQSRPANGSASTAIGFTATAPVMSRTPATGRRSRTSVRPAIIIPTIRASLCALRTNSNSTKGFMTPSHSAFGALMPLRNASRRK